MSINLSIFLLYENTPIFTGNVNKEEEIFLDLFSIKVFSIERIIISELDKKMIVKFSEIFSVNNQDYIIIDEKCLCNIVDYYPGKYRVFEFLNQSKFNEFILNLSKNLFYFKINKRYKNFYYIKRIIYFLIILLFFLTDRNITVDKTITTEALNTQKNIYFVYKQIDLSSSDQSLENDKTQPGNDKAQLGNGKTSNCKRAKRSKGRMPASAAGMTSKKGIDNEIQYFLR